MKICFEGINSVFDTEQDLINVLVIENQSLLYHIVEDIEAQLQGCNGSTILSNENTLIEIPKRLEILTKFIPFEISRRNLVSKVLSSITKQAVQGENYQEGLKILAEVELFLEKIVFDLPGDLCFTGINIENIIKSAGLELRTEKESLCEKILDYIELVTEYEIAKTFVTVNLRSFVNDQEMSLFLESVLLHKYNVIMIENKEYKLLDKEKRYVIDETLCEIS